LAADAAPELLTYEELALLSATPSPAGPLADKLKRLLATPAIHNRAARAGATPRQPMVTDLGPVVRVAFWNLEGGHEFEMIRLALADRAAFRHVVLQRGSASARQVAAAEKQLQALQQIDVLILNEADLGVSRSGYRDVAGELAAALNMNYAYGVEFVEVDPLLLGLETLPAHEEAQAWRAPHLLDPERFRGLHGNAILSRYPILSARMVRLPECYDWYAREKEQIAKLEKGRRWAARLAFEQRISRQIRHGGRMALFADLAIPDVPGGLATVVSVHLENRSRPACRQKQMERVLAELAPVPNPVILAGDLNTSGADVAPTSLRREVMRRISSLTFWIQQGLFWAAPVGISPYRLVPLNFFKNHQDPSVFHLPVLFPNREAGLFRRLARFQFDDRGAFDFSGSAKCSGNGRSKTLANSNERSRKGFAPTFTFERTYFGLVGEYKLDWFFVKPGAGPHPRPLSPCFPMTMDELNRLVPNRLSDHAPIIVDLLLPEAPPSRALPIAAISP
jgi:endonuclease/exonuclease/phosphatase family metal-dependent hydrolase